MSRNCFILTRFLLFVAVSGFLLTACAPQMPMAQAEVAPSTTPTATVTITSITSTTTTTHTPTPTLTPTATFTPTPTPITLPVTNGTPIPDLPYEKITAENVSRLRQIARYGYPRLLDNTPYRLTADGQTIAVGTTAGIEFYDAQTQEKTGALEVDFLHSFDLTPDGKYLLTFAGETLAVWSRDGQKVREFDLQVGDAWALKAAAISPDGYLLAVQRQKTDWQEADKVDVYHVQDGSLVDTVRGIGAVFSPDGQYLATVFDGSVRLYPVAELGQGWEKRLPKQTLPWCGGTENCALAFSPSGALAAVVRASRVDVYQVAERKAERKLVRQVSGWEAQDAYYLPTVQFAEGNLLVTTPPHYNSLGQVKKQSHAIVVHIDSGEWMNITDVPINAFAYLNEGQVQKFLWQLWQAGELPVFLARELTAGFDQNNVLNWYAYGLHGHVHCVQSCCTVLPFTIPITEVSVYDDSLKKYVLRFSPEWVLLYDDKEIRLQYSGYSFAVPDAKVVGDLLVVWAAKSQIDSQTVIFDKTNGKLLYRINRGDFSSRGDKVYLWDDNFWVEFDQSGKSTKHKYPDICKKSYDGQQICVIVGFPLNSHIYQNAVDFSFVKELLVVLYSDGFIRVWGIVK